MTIVQCSRPLCQQTQVADQQSYCAVCVRFGYCSSKCRLEDKQRHAEGECKLLIAEMSTSTCTYCDKSSQAKLRRCARCKTAAYCDREWYNKYPITIYIHTSLSIFTLYLVKSTTGAFTNTSVAI